MADIQAAVDAADPSQPVTIQLDGDLNISEPLTFNRDVTIDLNGNNLTV